jgi:dTDP-4-dehydrorhamnose reductase
MRVLITGCLGLLGQKLVELSPKGTKVFGLDLENVSSPDDNFTYSQIDMTDKNSLLEIVTLIQPDWIINAAAYTNVDGAETERDLCWKVNVTAVENLITCARKVKSKIVHISTDYIFDGLAGPYDELANPNPVGYYGRSKLAAENAFVSSLVDFAIARTMVLYGKEKNNKLNFVTWLLKKLQASEKVTIVTDQVGNTTLADELAEGCWRICQENFTGIVNVAGREIVDRFTFAKQIAAVFDLDPSLIVPITTKELHQPAPRPLNSGLLVDKAVNELGMDLSDVNGGLLKFKNQF